MPSVGAQRWMSAADAGDVIGIDLGTTNSCVAIMVRLWCVCVCVTVISGIGEDAVVCDLSTQRGLCESRFSLKLRSVLSLTQFSMCHSPFCVASFVR